MFVDTHLKPFRCNRDACSDFEFSSSSILLRHEREAHGMHGHGECPFLCTYSDCARRFRRHWNLQDHIRRVHDSNSPKSSVGTSATNIPPKGKKRKADSTSQHTSQSRSQKQRAESTGTSVADTALKSSNASPAIATKPSEQHLFELYHRRLLETVQQIPVPSNISLLRSAAQCIKVMAQITQRTNAATKEDENLTNRSAE